MMNYVDNYLIKVLLYIKKDIIFDVSKRLKTSKIKVMKTIGFADKFYTLWDCNKEVQYAKDHNGNGYATGTDVICIYIQNLSTDLETAKSKYPDAEVDLNLRGTGTFRVRGEHTYIVAPENYDVFKYVSGRHKNTYIANCKDVNVLLYGMDSEINGRRKANCRKRLIELGELVPYKWERTIAVWSAEYQDEMPVIIKRNYATPKEVLKMEAEKLERSLSGYFFTDGQKVKLSIKEIESFGFDGSYGYTYIVKYLTSDNKMVKYMGGTPPNVSKDEFTPVSATIKHSDYKGNQETKLQRIKII